MEKTENGESSAGRDSPMVSGARASDGRHSHCRPRPRFGQCLHSIYIFVKFDLCWCKFNFVLGVGLLDLQISNWEATPKNEATLATTKGGNGKEEKLKFDGALFSTIWLIYEYYVNRQICELLFRITFYKLLLPHLIIEFILGLDVVCLVLYLFSYI